MLALSYPELDMAYVTVGLVLVVLLVIRCIKFSEVMKMPFAWYTRLCMQVHHQIMLTDEVSESWSEQQESQS